MSFDDEVLLTTLGGALETHAAQPSADEVAHFRALVTGDATGEVLPFPEPVAPRGRRLPVLVAAATVAALMVAGAVVLGSGEPLPNSLRSPVRALGIPVDDAAVATVRRAWELGLRLFDTAPLYGAGLAERRLGAGRNGLIHPITRAAFLGSVEPHTLQREFLADECV